jgi:aminoglycoside phosphotransferase (APT) family kinase protein
LLPSSSAGDADALFDAVENFLQTRLSWFVAHRMLAEEIQRRSQKAESTLDVIDPATGDVDLTRYVTEHDKLIRKIADLTRVDAVLEADVEQVQVNFRSQVATWDGQQQLVSSKTSRTLTLLAAIPIDGHVPAATAVFKLWDPQGRLLWTHRRGFCVLALQQGIGTKFRDRPISEAVQDTEGTEKGLNQVFGSWLPAASSARAASKE